MTSAVDLRTLPEAFTDEWASEMARAALLYLAQRYVAGADLAVLEPWEDRVTAAAVEGDARVYREAMRGYVKALLEGLTARVLAGDLLPGPAAVANQLINTRLRAIEQERKNKESDELESRIEALERTQEKGARPWRGA